MNITCKCHSTPYLILLTLLLTCSVILSSYVLAQYGWTPCLHTHTLFKQAIISIFNSLITGCLVFYIIIMPERGHPNYNMGITKFNIGYLLQTILVIVNTYLFFDSGLYNFIRVCMDDCNMLYYYVIYVNVTLGCLPQYIFTLCFVIYYLIQCINYDCEKALERTHIGMTSTKETNTERARKDTPVFINPENISSVDYDDSELEFLIDARMI